MSLLTISDLCCNQEEQVKAEAERSKFEQTLKVLEGKLKTHQDNINIMKEGLASKEKEKEVSISNRVVF